MKSILKTSKRIFDSAHKEFGRDPFDAEAFKHYLEDSGLDKVISHIF